MSMPCATAQLLAALDVCAISVQDVVLLPDYLAIVMEYCNRGDLAEFMAGFVDAIRS